MATIDDLRSGRRPLLKEDETSALTGKTRATLQKDRTKKRGLPFLKDPRTGGIYYKAEAVLDFIDGLVECKWTGEYDEPQRRENIEKARQAQVPQTTA